LGDHEGGSYTGDFERTVKFYFIRKPYLSGTPRDVKEGSANGHFSPLGPRWGTWRGTRFIGDFERQMMERSGNGVSFSMGVLRGVPGKRAVKDM